MDIMGLAAIVAILTVILIVSFGSRARVFCQYLRFMTGLEVTPREVKMVFQLRGKGGVRELFLDLLIREDLKESPTITPETPRSKPVTELINK
ncbi:MAG: hypothetical protein GY856_47980 [bacterium]|nr:hypothetical protein [bacterium]